MKSLRRPNKKNPATLPVLDSLDSVEDNSWNPISFPDDGSVAGLHSFPSDSTFKVPLLPPVTSRREQDYPVDYHSGFQKSAVAEDRRVRSGRPPQAINLASSSSSSDDLDRDPPSFQPRNPTSATPSFRSPSHLRVPRLPSDKHGFSTPPSPLTSAIDRDTTTSESDKRTLSPSIRIYEIKEETSTVAPSISHRSRSTDSSSTRARNTASQTNRHRPAYGSLGDQKAWKAWAGESQDSLLFQHKDNDYMDEQWQAERKYEIWHPSVSQADDKATLKPNRVVRSPSVSSAGSHGYGNSLDLSWGSERSTYSDVSRSPSRSPHRPFPNLQPDRNRGRKPVTRNQLQEERRELIGRLARMLADKEEYKKLVGRKGSEAQKLLDMFQRLLDVMKDPPPKFQEQLIVAMQRLAVKSGLYPTCYELGDVTDPNTTEDSGRFADIYKAKMQGRTVCLKAIRRTSQTNVEHLLKVTAKEAILWGQLRHPNVVPFYGIYRIKQTISFVSPWMENGNILTYLKKHKESNRVILVFDIAQGLKFLHKNGVIHGDLKGAYSQANILVNHLGRVCLADFGLSSVSDKEVLNLSSFSTSASKGGTARWQAPELLDPEIDGVVPNTKCSDIYAWSLVAYEIFTGAVPFGEIVHELKVMRKVLDGHRPSQPPEKSLSWNVWGLTKEIWSLMESGWNKNPAKRPTIDGVLEHLERALPQDAVKEAGHADYLSPGKFREITRLDNEEIELSVGALESILNY
ncbi:hypothetical protein H0H92_002958 [Tricholoma furcatifolium]|nr:hypothetical protein H0H92_002958 [Tricholoma furcatifolium]